MQVEVWVFSVLLIAAFIAGACFAYALLRHVINYFASFEEEKHADQMEDQYYGDE